MDIGNTLRWEHNIFDFGVSKAHGSSDNLAFALAEHGVRSTLNDVEKFSERRWSEWINFKDFGLFIITVGLILGEVWV